MDSIFTKIIQGKLPCHKLFEDNWVFAFLDQEPLSVGHSLVVPKQQVAFFHELSEASAQALGKALRHIAFAIQKTTQCPAYNILQNNGEIAHQAIFHVHCHIIPKYPDHSGLTLSWKPSALNPSEGKKLAEQVQSFFTA